MPITLPDQPDYYENPRLDYYKVQQLQAAFIEKLAWLERAFHISKVGIDAEKKLGYPQIHSNKANGEHYDIRPDNKCPSYCFFEIERPHEINSEDDSVSYFLSVVFWNNLKLIDPDKTYDFTSELIKDVIDILKSYEAIDLGYDHRPESIFDKYSGVIQELKQGLMRNYSGFKITFKIDDSYSDNCEGEALNTCQMNIDRVNNMPTDLKACIIAGLGGSSGGGIVEIIDQNEDVIAEVEAPGTYQVEVLQEIVDTIDDNDTTIIDPLS